MYLVKLTKLSASQKPICPPGNWETYKLGKLNSGHSLPVDYEIIGILQAPPVVGQCVRVLRLDRNGVNRLGKFTSTEVVELTKEGFRTLNSVYKVVVLPNGQSPHLNLYLVSEQTPGENPHPKLHAEKN